MSTTFGARKQKVSNANGMKRCRLSEHVFSCLATLFDKDFSVACPNVKSSTPNLTSSETSVKSTHTRFHHTHPYIITSADLSVNQYNNLKLSTTIASK